MACKTCTQTDACLHLHCCFLLAVLSFLTVPMNKMSEWVRKKTVRQDHFFVRPIPLDSHWHPSRSSGEQQRLRNAASNSYSATNGSFPLHYTEVSYFEMVNKPGCLDLMHCSGVFVLLFLPVEICELLSLRNEYTLRAGSLWKNFPLYWGGGGGGGRGRLFSSLLVLCVNFLPYHFTLFAHTHVNMYVHSKCRLYIHM